MSINEQMIIIYTDYRSGAIKKESTAYTQDQQEYYFMRCLEKHGKKANVKAVPAKQLNSY